VSQNQNPKHPLLAAQITRAKQWVRKNFQRFDCAGNCETFVGSGNNDSEITRSKIKLASQSIIPNPGRVKTRQRIASRVRSAIAPATCFAALKSTSPIPFTRIAKSWAARRDAACGAVRGIGFRTIRADVSSAMPIRSKRKVH